MKSSSQRNPRLGRETSRRDFVKTPLVAGAAGALLGSSLLSAQPRQSVSTSRGDVIDEFDPGNAKIARRVSSNISDKDLLLLKQIGLRWAGVIFGMNGDLGYMRDTQRRFAQFGIKIYAGLHFAYRTRKIQLGQPGRDELRKGVTSTRSLTDKPLDGAPVERNWCFVDRYLGALHQVGEVPAV